MAGEDSTGAVSDASPMTALAIQLKLERLSVPYTGQRVDFESGLMFYKARVYFHRAGALPADRPDRDQGRSQPLCIVGNDPGNRSDPSGMCRSEICNPSEGEPD